MLYKPVRETKPSKKTCGEKKSCTLSNSGILTTFRQLKPARLITHEKTHRENELSERKGQSVFRT